VNRVKYSTRYRAAPPVESLPLLAEDYPRLFKLGQHAARATESTLEMIVAFDHNKIGMKAYLEKLGFTFIFLCGGQRVYVALSGVALLGDTDAHIIGELARQIAKESNVV
jgi:hypothetical protein